MIEADSSEKKAPESGSSLNILKEVERMYEEKMTAIDNISTGSKKLQMQVSVLRSWVDDLKSQNALLVRAVEDLEGEATNKVMMERRKTVELVTELQAEVCALRRRLARKDSDLRGLIEVLRRLREFDYFSTDGIHFHEVTESDIFGPLEWRRSKMNQGDGKNKHELRELRHDRFTKFT